MPTNKSTTNFKPPDLKSKNAKRSRSESILPNKYSKKFYYDCISKKAVLSSTLMQETEVNWKTIFLISLFLLVDGRHLLLLLVGGRHILL